MSTPYFSIVIPIYNVEKYLHQCVESVLAQSFVNIEVILIDDGSPDQCPQICDMFAEKDSRVKVVHKTNGGLSEARNCGILTAQGEYLLFLDSDDYWDDPIALEKIHTEITQHHEPVDVVMFQAKLLYPDGTIIPDNCRFVDSFNEMEKEESLRYMVENGLLIGSACSKVVRRQFLLEHDLLFKVGIKSEDIPWTYRVADALPKYLYTDQYFYMYRKGRPGSITTTVDHNHLCQLTDTLEEFSGDYKYTCAATEACVLSMVTYQLTILMASTANLPSGKSKTQLVKRIKALEFLFDYDMHPRVKLVNKVRKLVGFDCTMFLLGIYLKYRKR